ncbi:threonine synthase [Glaciibacter superstes]|uniref:threonine synthase n=1 Tax=Glaciibacter superstes TaxID=501023 RepID=UPI000404786D|nr:pyridoxal-phosphate dependent enzyme [Glaciibacter superstes]
MTSSESGEDARAKGGRRPYLFACAQCQATTAEFRYECRLCGGPLVLQPERLHDVRVEPSHRGIWRYRGILPLTHSEVSLGEGDTPLVVLDSSLTHGRREVYAKLESLNPTLSFKDRAMALGASMASDLGLRGLVVASTGNAAVAASAYAAAAGLECSVIVGTESNATKKLDACRSFGAIVEEVPGDYSAAYGIARSRENDGWMNVSTTYRNPLLAEAYRSIAFELIDELGDSPVAVIVPIGAGPLLRGIERGFQDAVDVGITRAIPKLVGVQAARVAPIYHEWLRRHGGDMAPTPRTTDPTIATAIADRLTGYESHGDVTISAVERSLGRIVAVGEESIVDSTRRLAAVGMWVEPSAATGVAALPQVVDNEGVSGGPIVVMLTGHGAKAQPLPAS